MKAVGTAVNWLVISIRVGGLESYSFFFNWGIIALGFPGGSVVKNPPASV